MKTGKVIGNIAAVTLGVVAGLGTAAAVGAVIGFKKWAKDEDSDCIRIVIGNARGIRISKTDEKDKYELETNYDWQADPDFFDCENCGSCESCCGDDEDCCCCEGDDCRCTDEDECHCCCVEVKDEETTEEPVKNADTETPAEA